ncbi:hypothetical protein BG003_010874 [Podila horticola]|nr:hypothetical protein BG003_010874 [Podila horticola]
MSMRSLNYGLLSPRLSALLQNPMPLFMEPDIDGEMPMATMHPVVDQGIDSAQELEMHLAGAAAFPVADAVVQPPPSTGSPNRSVFREPHSGEPSTL